MPKGTFLEEILERCFFVVLNEFMTSDITENKIRRLAMSKTRIVPS